MRRAGYLAGIPILALGLVWRLLASRALPVVFDEVCVMAYGLTRALGSPHELLFEVPVAVSNGVTPLWFWLQAIPAGLFGETSKAGLRTLPLLFGLGSVWACYRASDAIGGRRAAVVGGLLSAVHSPFLFANARGEYSESLLVLLVLLLHRDLHSSDGAPPPLRAALWPALALFAYLGKGLLVWGAYSLYVGLLWALGRLADRPSPPSLSRTIALVAAPLLPSLVWLVAAQLVLFAPGATVSTDLGPVDSVWVNVRRLTLGYGSEAQKFMVSGSRDALFVYTDFEAWPTLCLVAIPSLAALVGLGLGLSRALQGGDRPAAARALLPLCLVLVPAGVIVAKGVLDVRFHLLYLPILLLHSAKAVDTWVGSLEEGRWSAFLLAAFAGWGYVAWTQSGARPPARAGWAAAGAAALLAALLGAGSRRLARWAPMPALAALGIYTLWSSVAVGPLDWGRRWAWEPSPVPEDVPRDVRSFPNVDLQLAECALGRDEPQAYRRYVIQAIERHPTDRETVVGGGRRLLQKSPADAEIVVRALGEFTRRHQGDEEARRLLEQALAVRNDQSPGAGDAARPPQ